MLKALWTDEQVENLNKYQKAGAFHPFTCGNNGMPGYHAGQSDLVATKAGWICPLCDYTQDWAHEFMFTEEARISWLDRLKSDAEG